jgi:aspartate/methionine/tyrosine aminotransferase
LFCSQEDGLDFMANQYARSAGTLDLATELASRYSTHFNQKIDPLTNVLITNGASASLCILLLPLFRLMDCVFLP